MTEPFIYPNGIDTETGDPLLPPLPVDVVATLAQGQPIAKAELAELQQRQRMQPGTANYGVMAGIDPEMTWPRPAGASSLLSRTAANIPALSEALAPLLHSLRQSQPHALPGWLATQVLVPPPASPTPG